MWAAVAMLVAASPCLWVLHRGEPMAAVIAYEVLSSVSIMVLIAVAEAFGRSGEFQLAILLALLLFGSGMVFVRVLERWL